MQFLLLLLFFFCFFLFFIFFFALWRARCFYTIMHAVFFLFLQTSQKEFLPRCTCFTAISGMFLKMLPCSNACITFEPHVAPMWCAGNVTVCRHMHGSRLYKGAWLANEVDFHVESLGAEETSYTFLNVKKKIFFWTFLFSSQSTQSLFCSTQIIGQVFRCSLSLRLELIGTN